MSAKLVMVMIAVLRRSALLLVALCASACVDAQGRFDDYQKRLAPPDAGNGDASVEDAGPCIPPEPNAVQGPALLAIGTTLTTGKPILFLGTIDTPAFDGTTAVHFAYHALDARDRSTLVGEALEVGPFPLHDGELSALVPESELDGRANPVLYGAAVSSEMTLTGNICGVAPYYCGNVDGRTTGLVQGPLTGTFAITLLGAAGTVPDRPRYGCGADDLAEPLPD